ncbi:MAG: sulfite oxidase, partial [Cyclobacteriaceae bacterium]|nr:sulfite oxidase [Cyclobacteriaceae bacterium]
MKRRKFIRNTSLGTLSALLGAEIVHAATMPADYVPVALQGNDPYTLFGKHKDMVILNDRPWNVEAQAHLLDDAVTPADKMFIRNNGLIPEVTDGGQWVLQIDGESVKTPKTYSLNDLKTKFKAYTYQLTLECGGNGRSEFDPPAKGNQWTVGAVSCARWTGVRLRDLLEDAGIREDAVYVGYYGADRHLSGDASKDTISRGVPMWKALQDETLVAYEMNGEAIPLAHGFPLRLVAGGWPASVSGKWLRKLTVRNIVHDGEKMEGSSYRVPCETVAPGENVPDENMCIIESMPVKSLITYPKTGAVIAPGRELRVRGHAWAGEQSVREMHVSIDFGATWQPCELKPAVNRLAWQHFSATLKFPKKGYYEVWARATDSNGKMQPMVLPGWNPKGYLNNACHR